MVRQPPSQQGVLHFLRQRFFGRRSSTSGRPRGRVVPSELPPVLPEQETYPPPLLFVLARSCAWDAVLFRLQSHPEEAFFVDSLDRSNIFHAVCAGRLSNAEVMSALLETKSQSAPSQSIRDLLSSKDRNGCLPLHHACSYRCSPDVVQCLIAAYPDAVTAMATTTGFTPLHSLCNAGIVPDVLRVLLEYSPASICQLPRLGRTPLAWIHSHNFHRWHDLTLLELVNIRERQRALREKLKRRRSLDSWPEQAALTQELIDREEEEVARYRDGRFWQCVSLLVVKESSLPWPFCAEHIPAVIVCACFELNHMENWAILLYEQSIQRLDAAIFEATETKRSPLHWAASRGQLPLVEQLVNASPRLAAIRDRDGKTPLELWYAVSNDHPFALIDAYPLALLSVHENTLGFGTEERWIEALLPLLSIQSLFVLLRDGELIGQLQSLPSNDESSDARAFAPNQVYDC